MKDVEFGAFLCDLLKTRKEELNEIMGGAEIMTVMGAKMRLGDTTAFDWSRNWTPTLAPIRGYFCRAPQCSGGRFVHVKEAAETIRDDLTQPVGGINPFHFDLHRQLKTKAKDPEFYGEVPFHPDLWPDLPGAVLARLVESYERMERKIHEEFVGSLPRNWLRVSRPETLASAAMIVVCSFEQVLRHFARFGDKEMAGQFQAMQKDRATPYRTAGIIYSTMDLVFLNRGRKELLDEYGVLEDFRRFYDNGNIPLGLNADGVMFLLYQD